LGETCSDGLKSLAVMNNQRTVFINFQHDFETSTQGDFYQRWPDRSLIFWPNHSGELGCPIKKKSFGQMAAGAGRLTQGWIFSGLMEMEKKMYPIKGTSDVVALSRKATKGTLGEREGIMTAQKKY